MDKRKRDESIERYRAKHQARQPRPGEAPVDESTGLFQPSQNPKLGAESGPKALRLKRDLTQLEEEVRIQQRDSTPRPGEAYEHAERRPGDRFVGPDIGKRPHKPKDIPD